MTKWFSKTSARDTTDAPRSGNALRVAVILFLILLAFDISSTYNYLHIQMAQVLYPMLFSYVTTLFVFGCAWLIRRGNVNAGLWGLILTSLIALFLSPLLGSGLGLIYAVTAVIVTAVIAGQGLEPRQILWANMAGVGFGIATYLLDISLPVTSAAKLDGAWTYIILVVLLLVLVFMIASQFRTYTLRTKLIIFFLSVSIIPLSILTFINYLSNRAELITKANDRLASAAELTAYQLDSYFLQNINLIRSETQLPDVVDYLSLSETERADSVAALRIHRFISALAREDTIYAISVSVLDLKGNVLADTYSMNVGTNRAHTTYFKTVIQSGLPYVSSVQFRQGSNIPSLYFAAPVRDAQGTLIGVLSKEYSATILQAAVFKNNGLAGVSSFPILLDDNHILIASGNEQLALYKTLIPLDVIKLLDLQVKNLLPIGKPEELSANIPDLESGLNQIEKQPFFTIEFHEDDADVEQVTAAKMATKPWSVVFIQPQDVFLTAIDLQVRNNILVTIFISLLVAGLGFAVAQAVAGPIVRLTETADAIHNGNLDLVAKVESQDEIGKLAAAFNDMTLEIRNLINSLEQRVADRTRAAESARAESESARLEAESARAGLEMQFWLTNGQSQMADIIRGEQTAAQLSENILSWLCVYIGVQAGALFLLKGDKLILTGSYAYTARPGFDGVIELGEGLVGQAAANRNVLIQNVPSDALVISTGLTEMLPRQIAAAPFFMNEKIMGVLELATLSEFTQAHLELWQRISEPLGSAFHTVETRQRLAQLLLDSQQRSEKLQAQEEELRAANEELQVQAENLKVIRDANMRTEDGS